MDQQQAMDYTRQRDMFDPEKHKNAQVVMAGCGGIGSATALALAKLGVPHIKLIDFDKVEQHNIPNQMFPLGAEDISKVEALRQICLGWGGQHLDILALEKKIEDVPKQILRGILITGFDSMEARENAWKIAKNNSNIKLLIDGRLGKEDIVIYSVDPSNKDDIEYYESVALSYDDSEAEELACTERAIIDVMFTVASMITRLVRRHYTNDKTERVIVFNQNNLEVIAD